MTPSSGARRAVRAWTVLVLVFLYVPLLLVLRQRLQLVAHIRLPADRLHAGLVAGRVAQRGHVEVAGQLGGRRPRRNGDRSGPRHHGGVRGAAVSLLRPNVVSLLVVLPITLPGIVTGIALNATFTSAARHHAGHRHGDHRPCHVLHRHRLQQHAGAAARLGASLEDASADLGASPWQTFRFVTFPMMRGALVAGAILAFALSFDEIVVTTFTAGPTVQTLPIWIFGNLFRPNQAPVINVVAAALTLAAVIPVWLASGSAAIPRQPGCELGVRGFPLSADHSAGGVVGNGRQHVPLQCLVQLVRDDPRCRDRDSPE